MACGVAAGLVHGELKAQFAHGPYIGLEVKTAVPMNKTFTRDFNQGYGFLLKGAAQIGDRAFYTMSMDYMLHAAKPEKLATGLFKTKEVLTLQTGFRYNFVKEEEATAGFFVEPQIGWLLVGKDYNTFAYTPVVGYSFGGKFDVSAWYRGTTSGLTAARLKMFGVAVAYNIFLNGGGSED